LTSLILSERGYDLDEAGFEAAMQEQKSRSRAASESAAEDWIIVHPSAGGGFVGYDTLEAEVRLLKYRKVTSKKEGVRFQLVLDPTPFYPEGGGQAGDTGSLVADDGTAIPVIDTRKENNEILHITAALPTHPEGILLALVDREQRRRTACNHTATHLLHQALRQVLGNHVEQKGSAVHAKGLRFDFSHFSKLDAHQLTEVETLVNARIAEKLGLQENRNMPIATALEQGAMALFGEKYGDHVRAIRFGDSIELCGGTHVGNTADIWDFKILSEGAVAAGVRRIEAITSDAVRTYYAKQQETLEAIRNLLKSPGDPIQVIGGLQEENSQLKKELESLKREKAGSLKGELIAQIQEINGIHFLAARADLDGAAQKDLVFQMGSEFSNLFVVLAGEQDGKALLTCYISKELAAAQNLNAGSIVRELGKFISGGGGGQPFFATAGGKNPSGIPEALMAARAYLAN
jgi:alanyl-tRNA synthetase